MTPAGIGVLLDEPEPNLAGQDDMATPAVNLDALIQREDFAVLDDASEYRKIDTVPISYLEPHTLFTLALRKPDFQRETARWTPKKVSEFVKTFVDGDLVPAVILWRSANKTFVIDGAHRLSALIAWAQDDYGDGPTSRDFFQGEIPKEQKLAADRTRDLILRDIGTYKDHLSVTRSPESASQAMLERALRLGSLGLQLQWVSGDAEKAQASFFKINQEAVRLDATEMVILKARHSPNALAARAITRGGTGHKYWQGFAKDKRDAIENISRDIHRTLFEPPLDTPIKTLDLPVAGRGYSAQALPLVFDLVNLANEIRVIDFTKSNAAAEPRDEKGDKTVKFIKNTQRIVRRITGLHPSSLGLHPALYFYSSEGRYQPTSFLAVVSLIKYFDSQKLFKEFTAARSRFEEFLAANKGIPNTVANTRGSGVKGFYLLRRIYVKIFELIRSGVEMEKIEESLIKENDFQTPLLLAAKEKNPAWRGRRRDFDSATKSAIFLRDALENPLRCKICGGLIHYNSITVDHLVRRNDGGLGVKDNGQLAHPYCNSTIKN